MNYLFVFCYPLKIGSNADKDFPSLLLTVFVNKPFLSVSIVFAIVAAIYTVTEWHYIPRNCAGVIRSCIGYCDPMIVREFIARPFFSSADSALVVEIVKTFLPIINSKIRRQIAYSSSTVMAFDIKFYAIVLKVIASKNYQFVVMSHVVIARSLFSAVRVLLQISLLVCLKLFRVFIAITRSIARRIFAPLVPLFFQLRTVTVSIFSLTGEFTFWVFLLFSSCEFSLLQSHFFSVRRCVKFSSFAIADFTATVVSVFSGFVFWKFKQRFSQFAYEATFFEVHLKFSLLALQTRLGKAVRLAFRAVHEATLSRQLLYLRMSGVSSA